MSKSYLGVLGEAPVVMIIGPVAYWWDTDTYQHWNTPEHWHYVAWREQLCDALIESGYLTYRHWEAFKGTWNNKMQGVNNYILGLADYIINICPSSAWSEGTQEEMQECYRLNKKVIYGAPPQTKEEFSWAIKDILEELAKDTSTAVG